MDPSLAVTLAAIVDEGTLDGAARRLHLTPSAVSQRVKTLEEQLGWSGPAPCVPLQQATR